MFSLLINNNPYSSIFYHQFLHTNIFIRISNKVLVVDVVVITVDEGVVVVMIIPVVVKLTFGVVVLIT
jgi:hypothetical protein